MNLKYRHALVRNTEQREANLKHRRAVNRAAVAALVASAAITEEQAQEVIKAIHGGLIPRVSISY